jgi:excinuclease ABC subunit A
LDPGRSHLTKLFCLAIIMDLSYYTSHSPFSDPGHYTFLYTDLPDDLPGLIQVVQGFLIHKLVVDFYQVELSAAARAEQLLRTIEQRLKRMLDFDPAPLRQARQPKDRQVGVCRDFALLLVSLLRHKGLPARMRVGFAKYLDPHGPYKYDHWITEYWDAAQERWVLCDPQIDDIQRHAIGIQANTLNLKRGEDFFLAGEAWELCRAGKDKSLLFRFSGKWKGMPCIRGNLMHDLRALNKVELTPFDVWDSLSTRQETQLSVEDKALLDRIARLTTAAPEAFEEIQALFAGMPETREVDSRLRLLGFGAPAPAAPPLQLGGSGLERLATYTGEDARARPTNGRMLAQLGASAYDVPEDSALSRLIDTQVMAVHDPFSGDIMVRGARQHNLKHIDVRIPRHKLVVVTGVSGSGKSSLAFDTIYAEGQRRYVESLSSYARQFMGQMEKPLVDQITGLSPAIAIEQKTVSRNPRSTVGTVTEILDYLRVLYARVGTPHCPQCGRSVEAQSAQQITDQLAQLAPGTRFQLLAPVVRNRKGAQTSLLRKALMDGYTRARVDGNVIDLLDKKGLPVLDKNKKHAIDLVVDRLIAPEEGIDDAYQTRLMDSVETCLRAAEGVVTVALDQEEITLSEHHACPVCELSFPELQPTLFSFNSPVGMCPECNGLGVKLQVDIDRIITNPNLSLLEGASRWHGDIRKKSQWHIRNLQALASHYGVDLTLPWKDLPESFQNVILYGSNGEKIHFEYASEDGSWKGEAYRESQGTVFHINRLFRQTRSEYTRRWYMSFMSQLPCPACQGERLCPEARFVTVADKRLPELTSFSIASLYDWVKSLPPRLQEEQRMIGVELVAEIQQRLGFLRNVGLHYLNLDRPAPTLSGGEGQRIRLASQIGSGLVGVLYILDEPSIGLHARDGRALLDTLTRLRDLGNTVLVVEHDAETMRTADWIIDLGPGAGLLGGEVVAEGPMEDIIANKASLTGRYLSGELLVTAPNGRRRRTPNGVLTVRGARLHNLKNIEARFPLGAFICITGVSGSGKSSLISQTLFPALSHLLHNAQSTPGPYDAIDGLEQLDKVINITQEPIGRNPRSNPGTYVGLLNEIREVFANMPEAKAAGYKAGRFSFNIKGGRCEACMGYGYKRVEMHFLADVWVKCKECQGKRFNRQTLSVTYKGKSIADVLDMDVQEAMAFFANHPAIMRILQTLHDVGLDYVKLGQSALTLSGGEAQRVKLSKELSRIATGKTIYILDEPTTGLHFADIQRLLDVLHRLVDAGNTVVVIEHNLDVIKTADWIIDLGPEGGDEGGYILAEGTPETVAQLDGSHTGRFLREMFLRSTANVSPTPGVKIALKESSD